jgi:hypothetical protein
MLARPNPTRLPELFDGRRAVKHRRMFCGWYDHCERQAEDGGWESWTCARCPLYVLELSVPRALA